LLVYVSPGRYAALKDTAVSAASRVLAVTDAIVALRREAPAMVRLLTDLAALESPTDDPQAVGALLDRVSVELRASGLLVRRTSGRASAGALVARPVARVRGLPVQLLVGHCDTVWPVGTTRHMPVEVVGDEVRGPGVFDMKGGIVQMIFALRTLRALAVPLPATPVVVLTSDEETGGAESKRHIVRLARRATRLRAGAPPTALAAR
jgi:glutamate carboxypeptidase